MIKKIKNVILDFLLKHNFIISTLITIAIVTIFYENLIVYFNNNKKEILDMIISVSGTLFGFVLTFLTVFIVFRTEEKYKKIKNNESKPIIMLVNNESFDNVYKLFISSSYSLGLLLTIAIVYFFTSYGLNFMINSIFIISIMELIVICVIRLFVSICTFNTLINILINNNNK